LQCLTWYVILIVRRKNRFFDIETKSTFTKLSTTLKTAVVRTLAGLMHGFLKKPLLSVFFFRVKNTLIEKKQGVTQTCRAA
jgi:hypothetical protein